MIKLQKNDCFSRISFGQVVDVGTTFVTVKNQDGQTWQVDKNIIEAEFNFAHDDSLGNEHMSREDLVKEILSAKNTAMTIVFTKQIEDKDIIESFSSLIKSSDLNSKQKTTSVLKQALKEAKEDKERLIVGYHKGSTNSNGRLIFFDMENNNEIRLVDLRTIKSAIFGGKNFIVK